MRYEVGRKVIANKDIVKEKTSESDKVVFCLKGQELIINKCLPLGSCVFSDFDAYIVQDIKRVKKPFFINCNELY